MTKVSAIIVIKGNPPHLEECLSSINSLVDEIILGFIQIEDSLKKSLTSNNKIKLIELPPDIPFADMVKEDLKKKASGTHILYIDPDELFPQKAVEIIKNKLDAYNYFIFPRKNIIFGKWINHSRWWPDPQIRFFKKEAVIWPSRIHPQPVVKGKAYTFDTKEEFAFTHYNYDTLDQYLEKNIRYAKAEAKMTIKEGKSLELDKTITKGLSEFVSRFFPGEGFRHGTVGFTLAFLQMMYYFIVYFYYLEMKKFPDMPTEKLTRLSGSFFSQGLKETYFWVSKLNLISNAEKLKAKILNKLA